MGAWGEGPMESDGALDWVGDNVTDPLTRRIRGLLEDFDAHGSEVYAEPVRGAAAVVVRLDQLHPVREGFNVYTELISRLDKIRDDEAWLSAWSSNEVRENVRTSIDAQIRALRNLAAQFQIRVN